MQEVKMLVVWGPCCRTSSQNFAITTLSLFPVNKCIQHISSTSREKIDWVCLGHIYISHKWMWECMNNRR